MCLAVAELYDTPYVSSAWFYDSNMCPATNTMPPCSCTVYPYTLQKHKDSLDGPSLCKAQLDYEYVRRDMGVAVDGRW